MEGANMKKTNFSKVEKALEEGLLSLAKGHLLSEASRISHSKANADELPAEALRGAIFQAVDRELKKIWKRDASAYKKIGFQRQELKKLIADPSLLTPQDWQKIKEVRERIEDYKKELSTKLPAPSNTQIVEEERVKQSKARFNVNKKWIPLS